jgi:hypothetical protein
MEYCLIRSSKLLWHITSSISNLWRNFLHTNVFHDNISLRWGRWDTMTMASYSYSFHHAAILGWYEEFSHRISLVHNFVNILPLSTIVAFPCSLLRSLSATETLARWELWGRRYCYWRQRQAAAAPWFDVRRWCVLCVVRRLWCVCATSRHLFPPLAEVFCTNSTIRRQCHVDSIDLSNTNYSYLLWWHPTVKW